MDFELSPRARDLARKGREFCDQVLVPLEIVTDEHGELPMERRDAVKQAVRDWGLAGINQSKEHGGLGLTMVEQTAIELSKQVKVPRLPLNNTKHGPHCALIINNTNNRN